MRHFALLFTLLSIAAQAQFHRITPPPDWVTPIAWEGLTMLDTACSRGGTQYLLADLQFHLGQEKHFFRLVTRLTSPEAVQNNSRIHVDVDPSYQKLELHMARIIRAGRVIDQLDASRIQVLQRERDLNSFLYDGTRSIILEFDDVRPGDIVEQAYTIKGNDAAGDGRFNRRISMGYAVPLAHQFVRIIAPKGRELVFHGHLFDEHADIHQTRHGTEHIWDWRDVPCIREEENTPAWHSAFPELQVSEFKDLEEVRSWAIRQFDVDMRLGRELEQVVARTLELPDPVDRIDSAIHIVQRKVRYLGLENGISAYRPRPPAKVYEQRFGDCKDRSLLLVAMLRKLGIEAWPVLVNTREGAALERQLPRPGSFDHCITLIRHDGDLHWIDPTSTYNRGRLHERHTADMGAALVVDPAFTGWTMMKKPPVSTVEVTERFEVESIGGGAVLDVESRYTHGEADRMRGVFSGEGIRTISDLYRDFYFSRHGYGTVLEQLRVEDDVVENVFTTYEKYELPGIWDTLSQGGLYINFMASVLKDQVIRPNLKKREAPYALPSPIDLTQRIIVDLPEDWPVQIEPVDIEGYGIRYSSRIINTGPVVEMTYQFRSDSTFVAATDIGAFQAQQQRILDDLEMTLTHTGEVAMISTWKQVKGYGTLLMFLALGIWGMTWLYKWDPAAHPLAASSNPLPIGGWLILPAIGLFLGPLIMLRDILADDAWMLRMGVYDPMIGLRSELVYFLYIQFSQIHAIGMLCLSVITCVLFVKRRTSIPFLMRTIYIITAVFLTADMMLYSWMGFEGLTGEKYDVRDVGRSFFAAMIWVPYFWYSERVRNTFVQRGSRQDGDLPTVQVHENMQGTLVTDR